jgi:hypothetical protein
MLLYHFTRFERLETTGTILRDGLLVPSADNYDMPVYLPGIWLTSNPEPIAWWEGGGWNGIVRITVSIPSNNRLLKHAQTHFQKHMPYLYRRYEAVSIRNGIHWEEWYVYFGAIKPKRLKDICHCA